jgi:HD superfamily phosphohydrolase
LSIAHYPTLTGLAERLDDFLKRQYPDFFGQEPMHPVLPLKRSKVIHDAVFGTNKFSWRELLLIDSPIIQRLREIHQVGLAHFVYPSARHTRFEHTLGVATLASRIFDAIYEHDREKVRTLLRVSEGIPPGDDKNLGQAVSRLRQELRLAALLHDSGHSLFSHVSEQVYSRLNLLTRASEELSSIAGMSKGAGEALSFCLALTKSVQRLLNQPASNLLGESCDEDYLGSIDATNVALLIVGRSRHPFLQFLGDIISSSLDADKLDYLMRDSFYAGLPLRYDLDMYLHSVRIHEDVTADGVALRTEV